MSAPIEIVAEAIRRNRPTVHTQTERPANLLQALCLWHGRQGGTIHQYDLSELRWERVTGQAVHRMGPVPVWSLEYRGVSLGWLQCRKADRPAIDAYMSIMWEYVPMDLVIQEPVAA